ncbi:MAG: hypothetical protein WBF43_12910 [Methylocella sp.]
MLPRYRVSAPQRLWGEPIATRGAATMTERLTTAYHEAAHAFVAVWEGIPVEDVSVTDDGRGKCSTGAPPGDVDKVEWIKKRLRISYAGMEAQRYINPHTMFECSWSDRQAIDEIAFNVAAIVGEENAATFADRARQETAKIIDEFWPLIKRLALELNRRGRMSGDEVRSALWRERGV